MAEAERVRERKRERGAKGRKEEERERERERENVRTLRSSLAEAELAPAPHSSILVPRYLKALSLCSSSLNF